MNAEVKRNMATAKRTEDFKAIVDRAKAKGLVREAGAVAPAAQGNQAAGGGVWLEAVVAGTAYRIRLEFLEVTPVMARGWLIANNKRNRKLRETTEEAYARDMRNGDWLLNHQGLAFNDADELIDGQHRLAAVVRSGCTVTLLVSYGWPATTKSAPGRAKLMDTVDRGAARSIADLLGLQHGIVAPRQVVMTATALARVCANPSHCRKMTTPVILGVIEAFAGGIKFAVENRSKSIGLRQANVLGALALAHAVHPEQVADFMARLETGECLTGDSPILRCRNWLLEMKSGRGCSKIAMARDLAEVAHYLWLHVTGKNATFAPPGPEGLDYFRLRQPEAVAKVKKIVEGGITS